MAERRPRTDMSGGAPFTTISGPTKNMPTEGPAASCAVSDVLVGREHVCSPMELCFRSDLKKFTAPDLLGTRSRFRDRLGLTLCRALRCAKRRVAGKRTVELETDRRVKLIGRSGKRLDSDGDADRGAQHGPWPSSTPSRPKPPRSHFSTRTAQNGVANGLQPLHRPRSQD